MSALKPFWNNRCLELSRKIWLPTESSYSAGNSYSKCFPSNHLFETTTLDNSQPSNYLEPQINDEEIVWDKDAIRPRKIKLYPTKKQKKKLKKWIGTTRYVYNNALNGIKNNKERINAFELRNKYVTYEQGKAFGVDDQFLAPSTTKVEEAHH